MTFPSKKSINTELIIDKTTALYYILETQIKVGANAGDHPVKIG